MNLPDRSTARNSTPSKDAGEQPRGVRIENMPMQECTVGPLKLRNERPAAEALAECLNASSVTTHAAPLFVP